MRAAASGSNCNELLTEVEADQIQQDDEFQEFGYDIYNVD